MVEALIERLRAYPRDKNGNFDILAYTLDGNEAADRIEALERELAEGKRRNAELDREITGLRNSYWEERKAHLAAEADKARLSEALRECIGYITSPLRLSDDGDEVARRNSIAVRARAALSGSNAGWRAVPVEPSREHLERLARLWGYTLEETADSYAAFLDALPAAPQPTGGE